MQSSLTDGIPRSTFEKQKPLRVFEIISEGAVISGAVVSETIIDWVFETVLPAPSVTCQTIVLLPRPIMPAFVAIVYDGVKLVQLSVAEATPMTTEQVLVIISAGIVRTGSSLSMTVIN